jgi:hypothetical protein
MDNFDLKKYLAEGKLLKEEKFNGAIIRKGSSDKSKEDTKIVRQALKDKGIKFTNRGEFGMDFKDADLAQIKKVIAGAKVGEFIISRDVNENNLLKEEFAGVFSGWADDMLGMEEPTFSKGPELKLRSKADAGKTSLTYYFQLSDKKGDGNLQMYITVGDEPSIKYRANNLDDSKVKAYIDKRKDDFVRRFDFIAEQNSKEEMGKKYHVGSGYEDKVTDEDVASIKDGIKKLKSLKIETF